MKSWMLVCLVACATRFNTSMCQNVWENCTGVHGEIRVIGINSDDLTVGRIEMCFHEHWAAVCDRNWGLKDASVVCQQLGFSRLGTTVQACRNSCFGQSPLAIGIRDYNCMGNESRLLDCPSSTDYRACGDFAGIRCSHPEGRTEEQTCPTPTCPTPTFPSTEGEENMEVFIVTCTALGALAAIAVLSLVGVVLGWAWSCRRSKAYLNVWDESSSKADPEVLAPNPCYAVPLSDPHPSPDPRTQPNTSYATSVSLPHTDETTPPTYEVIEERGLSSQ